MAILQGIRRAWVGIIDHPLPQRCGGKIKKLEVGPALRKIWRTRHQIHTEVSAPRETRHFFINCCNRFPGVRATQMGPSKSLPSLNWDPAPGLWVLILHPRHCTITGRSDPCSYHGWLVTPSGFQRSLHHALVLSQFTHLTQVATTGHSSCSQIGIIIRYHRKVDRLAPEIIPACKKFIHANRIL